MDIFGVWSLVEQDLADVYGIDTDDVMDTRTWAWLQTKIAGLLNRPRVAAPDGTMLPTTRLDWYFNPPQPKQANDQ